MIRHHKVFLKFLTLGLFLFVLTGCVQILGAVGTGAVVTGEYVLGGSVTKTITHEFARIKKALFVALRSMEILKDKEREVEGGEEIMQKTCRFGH